ncbi:hypothetical protein H671_5g15122 [Cricetulus griseus]|nr:hypothetical protein H671_5g15122 [Cricetulus griseus]
MQNSYPNVTHVLVSIQRNYSHESFKDGVSRLLFGALTEPSSSRLIGDLKIQQITRPRKILPSAWTGSQGLDDGGPFPDRLRAVLSQKQCLIWEVHDQLKFASLAYKTAGSVGRMGDE